MRKLLPRILLIAVFILLFSTISEPLVGIASTTISTEIAAVRGVAIATVMGTVINTALNYLDIGTSIAKLIDSRDWYPKNGYIDITK